VGERGNCAEEEAEQRALEPGLMGPRKTRNARRTVKLDKVTVAILREHRKVQLEQRILMGKG
jgi:hypothetical protein